MKKALIRVWHEQDIEEIEKHLLIVGDMYGDCGHCHELGLEYASVKECPQCHAIFKYIACRHAARDTERSVHEVKRVVAKRGDLVCIDYDDYKKISGKHKAKKFFE
ncbi:MAG: hypothetical protein KKH94_10125 [Candidatus Omnitrophica bacterium]|nr:hypothetical protein [Candidatus Omnitrophota bacterium]